MNVMLGVVEFSAPHLCELRGELAMQVFRLDGDGDFVVVASTNRVGEHLSMILATILLPTVRWHSGLVNKPTLNLIDEDMLAKLGKAKFVLLVETQMW